MIRSGPILCYSGGCWFFIYRSGFSLLRHVINTVATRLSACLGHLGCALLAASIGSCDVTLPPDYPELTIVTNSWIGYSPVYYASASGQLDPLNIKLINVVSLAESRQFYQSGLAQIFAGTQYEYGVVHATEDSLVPVIMLDRSSGGDVVLCNCTLDTLHDGRVDIHVYLEMDSVNQLLLQQFVQQQGLVDRTLRYHDMDQGQLSSLRAETVQSPALLISYAPYDVTLKQAGFRQLASTRDDDSLVVVDALFATRQLIADHRQQLLALKNVIRQVQRLAQEQTPAYCELISDFVSYPSPRACAASLQLIEWLDDNPPEAYRAALQQMGLPLEDLL